MTQMDSSLVLQLQSQPLGILLKNVYFDNVRLEAEPVPEPTTVLGLLAFSAVGASFTTKKKSS
jgi:hypothetical protein